MKKLYFLVAALLFVCLAQAQESGGIRFKYQDPGPLPPKHRELHPVYGKGPANNHAAAKLTTTTYSDWYDLWDAMYDTGVSYSFYYEVYPDSNLLDTTGFYPAYQVFTHGIGMSFDPTDSAYYYHAVNSAYQVSEPFPYTHSYKLDSFFVVGQYVRYDPTASITDSLIVEFIVTQNGGAPPDSGAYALIFSPADTIYQHCSADQTPRFATPRYFNTADECVDPFVTTVTHQRYAFPQTAALAFVMNRTRFGLTTPIDVPAGKYLTAYVYFKSQVSYPAITGVNVSNSYRLWAGEPTGYTNWFPQSAHNTSTGYSGSHQTGLIATNQIRYSAGGFTYAGHDVLIPSYAYAHTGSNPSSGFDVPEMAFHIKWSVPDISLGLSGTGGAAAAINVFPNPCDDLLNFSYTANGTTPATVTLTNMLGQMVATQEMGAGNQSYASINTSELPGGIYICTIKTGNEEAKQRVEVLHNRK